jgi:molecular chaperone DnaK (HSP70)
MYKRACCSPQVRNQESGVPQLVAVSSAVSFDTLDLTIHSYSADWLYQALLYIFSGTIKRQVEEALDGAMHTVSVAVIVFFQQQQQQQLYIFSGTIKRQVEEALDGAMHTVSEQC